MAPFTRLLPATSAFRDALIARPGWPDLAQQPVAWHLPVAAIFLIGSMSVSRRKASFFATEALPAPVLASIRFAGRTANRIFADAVRAYCAFGPTLVSRNGEDATRFSPT